MKKFAAFLSAIILCTALVGCKQTDAAQTNPNKNLKVYSFSGQSEICGIANGVIVLTPDTELLYGGNLTVEQDLFDDISSYTTSFYLSADGENDVLLSNSASDLSGQSLPTPSDLGQITGDVFTDSAAAEFEENLYFELEVTSTDGSTQTYKLPLDVKELA